MVHMVLRSRRAALVACLAVILALVLPSILSAAAVARTPQTGDFFEYDYNTYVDQGADAYTGYTDSMHAHYRFSVQSVSGETVTMLGTGSWNYQDSNGLVQNGSETHHPVFSLTTREYLSGIDVNLTGTASVWFWIPTNVSVGQVVYVLDEPLTVTSMSATVWLGAVPHSTVLLEGSGTYTRDDVYGVYTADYHDQYYYDRDTGYIVSEQYTEQDVGTYQGMAASFRFRAETIVTASSYPIPLDLLSFSLVYIGVPAAIVLTVVGVIRVRRGPSRLRLGSGAEATYVRIRKVTRPAQVTGLVPDGSPYFGPFLSVFAERSIAEGDPVALALDGQKIVGMALMDRESGMGSLFAGEDKVVRVLLKRIRMRDFFADATIPARVVGAKEIDRFTILQLRNPQAMDYDAEVVRPMKPEDLPGVIALAENVYRGRAAKFLQSSFKGGDLGFVATSAGRIMGFGFATVVGTVARLHTLTVAAPDRARGVGTEIMNARISALAVLGVDRIIVEISKQNAASLRIATKVGFVPFGETVYYSRNPPEAPSAMQRQT
jgi:L-amino acid N-acyltransferase YncA